MTANFQFPAGGFLRSLSPKAKDQIHKRCPALPIEAVSREAGFYMIMRDANHPSPGDARKHLTKIRNQARKLHESLSDPMMSNVGMFVDQAAGVARLPMRLSDIARALLELEYAIAKGATYIPSGHLRTPRDRLANSVAAIMLDAGESLDKAPKGTFCTVLGIVLEDCGESPSDVRKLAAPIVDGLEKMRRK